MTIDNSNADPPALRNFRREVARGTADARKCKDFEKFLQRYPSDSPVRKEGEELLKKARLEKSNPQYVSSSKPVPKASRFTPTGNADAGDPSKLGQRFHNPYTFIPFPPQPPARRPPTPLTIDEIEPDRFTGTFELEIQTLSPLLTCMSKPIVDQGDHKSYRALTIGRDVILPATGVRGSLRTLLSIIAGGTLGYVDDEVWLCQGRDVALGPRRPNGPTTVPGSCFLAEVVHPGNRLRPGRVRLGKTKLVPAEKIETLIRAARLMKLSEWRKPSAPPLWIDKDCTSVSAQKDPKHCWRLKLSGEPIRKQGKREGAFYAEETVIDLAPDLWSAYEGRNRHGIRPELRQGDLVWLEPHKPDLPRIERPEQVKSIQWARWGRQGRRMKDVVPEHMLPDAERSDGLVDEVTDLLGQVARSNGETRTFAARVRFENLVFFDANNDSDIERSVPLAPLAPPHPGCVAFYGEWNGDPAQLDKLSVQNAPLRGFKVYRTTQESGTSAPWRFEEQGVYGEDGRTKDPRQKVNKTCDLLKAGRKGRLRIAVRALSRREIALLLAACSVDWRLGGGKPLGLGWCRVVSARVLDETGQVQWTLQRSADHATAPVASLPSDLQDELRDQDRRRLQMWQATQRPVAFLRYPRAADENKNKKNRGGHAWFARHASPKKSGKSQAAGLAVMWIAGELAKQVGKDRIRAQALPPFDPNSPDSDGLYGYDLFSGDSAEFRVQDEPNRTVYKKLEPFDPNRHARSSDRSGGPQSPNRERRS